MFVENLTMEQVEKFVEEHLKKDFNPEFMNTYRITLERMFSDEPSIDVFYCTKSGVAGWSHLLADGIVPFGNREMEKAWIQYLHSIFGDEYKNWYFQEKVKLFETKAGKAEL